MRPCLGYPGGHRVDVFGQTFQTFVPHVPGVDLQVPLVGLEVRRMREVTQDDQLGMPKIPQIGVLGNPSDGIASVKQLRNDAPS